MTQITKEVLFAFLLSALFGAGAQAATVNAASCTQSDVQAAINSASSGDTVLVPGGSCSWSGTVTVPNTKQITLSGGGNTTITWNSGGLDVTAGTTTNTRVTGFTFNGSYTNGGCPISFTTATSPLTQAFRFYSNTLNGGSPSAPATFICVRGNGPGLLDHNSFTASHGADEMIHVMGNGASDASGWTDSVPPGGQNMIFVEDSTFTESGAVVASALQSYYGARTVVRHNTFSNAQIDQHGGGGIGARWWEFYSNTFNTGDMCLRAGSGLVFSNSGAGNIFMLQENGSYPAAYQVGRGQNQITYPAYAWNNGSTSLRLNSTGCAPPAANMVQLNRDVYQPNSGTTLPGTCSTDQPFFKTDEGTLYKCTSPNTWKSYYTPYTYPHPLQSGGGSQSTSTAPQAPTGLTALVY
jgi:hypothetical protein